VRTGESQGQVTAAFDLPQKHPARDIAKLQEIKTQQGGYYKKAMAVDKIAEEAKNYADFWDYKLNDWATD
jgi:DNA repair ATPase RecN